MHAIHQKFPPDAHKDTKRKCKSSIQKAHDREVSWSRESSRKQQHWTACCKIFDLLCYRFIVCSLQGKERRKIIYSSLKRSKRWCWRPRTQLVRLNHETSKKLLGIAKKSLKFFWERFSVLSQSRSFPTGAAEYHERNLRDWSRR